MHLVCETATETILSYQELSDGWQDVHRRNATHTGITIE
jgi:hypothetical protein